MRYIVQQVMDEMDDMYATQHYTIHNTYEEALKYILNHGFRGDEEDMSCSENDELFVGEEASWVDGDNETWRIFRVGRS